MLALLAKLEATGLTENAMTCATLLYVFRSILAILPAAELASLRETAHLMRSPKNAHVSSRQLPERTTAPAR
jgi:hypothetical protein